MVISLSDMSYLGVILHIWSSVFIVYGQTEIKVSFCIKESSSAGSSWLLHYGRHQPQWRRPDGQWRIQIFGSKVYALMGWVAFVIGNLIRFVSMRFASQTVLSGLSSIQFVIIPLASYQLLGIKPQSSTALGVIAVLVGNLLILKYGPQEVTFSPSGLRKQWTTSSMRLLLVVIILSIVFFHVLWRIIHRRRRIAEAERPKGQAISGDPDPTRMFVGALLFSVVSSCIGAWSVLFGKSLTYIVGSAPQSLHDWYSWFIIVAFIGTAGYWINKTNKGLKLYPMTLILPLMQSFWMAMSVIEGMIYFDEIRALNPGAFVAIIVGLALAMVGAIVMSGFINEKSLLMTPQVSGTLKTSTPLEYLDLEENNAEEQYNIMRSSREESGTWSCKQQQPLAIGAAVTPGNNNTNNKVPLIESSGRIDGLSSPFLRENKALASLHAVLEAELARVTATWRAH